MNSEKKKRRLTAIDVFIIFAVLAVLVAAGLRLYENYKLSDEGSVTEVVCEKYIVSFESKGMKESTANLLEEGELFYLTGGKTEFGTLEKISTTPAKVRLELTDGELKTDVIAEKNGNNTKVDVSGTFLINGRRDANNIMKVEGQFHIAPNLPVTVFSNKTSLSFTITGIEKAE